MNMSSNSDLCRVCLKMEGQFFNIFTVTLTNNYEIYNAIMECAPVNIQYNDNFPSTICIKCYQNLQTAYEFRMLCVQTDKFLHDQAINSISSIKTDEGIENYQNIDFIASKIEENISDYDIHDDNTSHTSLLSPKIEIVENSSPVPLKTKRKKIIRERKPKKTKKKEIIKPESGDEKLFQCDICLKYYSSPESLRLHSITHSGEIPYACTICGQRFRWSSNVKRHMRVHTGEKNYMCDICSKRFANVSTLIDHKRRHLGERPFECALCGKRFSDHANLAQHRYVHNNEKRYECTFCGRGFPIRSRLNTHLRIHTSEKPFPCPICGKCFAQKVQLQAHTYSHTNEQPFCCEVCNKRFKGRNSLNRHKKTHEKNIDDIKKFIKNELNTEPILNERVN